jgi:hypothetical protein
MASLLFLAAAVLVGGCSNHSDSFGDTSSATGSTGSSGGSSMPAAGTDLAAFARAGIADSATADPREVNDVTFTSDENPDAFNDVF